jgi:hypothetical protein
LALRTFEAKAKETGMAKGKFDSVDLFLRGYDLLNEYGVLSAQARLVLLAKPPETSATERLHRSIRRTIRSGNLKFELFRLTTKVGSSKGRQPDR